MKAYGGYINDKNILLKCASGGLATAMYQQVISKGGVAYGVVYTNNFKGAEYVRITTLEEIEKLQSSKYIRATLKDSIKDSIIRDIKEGKNVLFIGIPCDVVIIKNILRNNKIDDKNIIFVDLSCHGPADPEVAEQYVDIMEKKYKSKIKSFNARYKNPAWAPMYLKIEFENGKVYTETLVRTEYGIAFDNMCDEMCYRCPYKGEYHTGDITIGDFWGVNSKHPSFNIFGTSLAVTHNDKGDSFLKSIDNIKIFDVDIKKLMEGKTRYRSDEKIRINKQFKENFKLYGLKGAVAKHLGFKGNLKLKVVYPLREKIADIKNKVGK